MSTYKQLNNLRRLSKSELYGLLGDTEYGQILQDNVRFGRFKPDCIPNEVWVDALGADVNNFQHMQNTAEITAWYIFQAEKLGAPMDRLDQSVLMMTAWTHDFAEAIDGDIPDPDKDHSQDAKEAEKQSWLTVMGSIVPAPELIGNVVFPVLHGESPLARDFRAIELIGYNETALRAVEQAHNLGELQMKHELSIPQLRALYGELVRLYDEVHPSCLQSLEAFRDLPVIEEYLNGQS